MIKWKECAEERYDEMLCVLPPASQCPGAFQVGEASDNHNGQPTFATFKRADNKFYEAEDTHTFREFKEEFPTAEYYYE